jgi:hypothetical protein
MKRCPKCQQTSDDETIRYCGLDGALLVNEEISSTTTMVSMPLSPSETLLLHGEQFAGAPKNNNYSVRLLHNNQSVSSEQLGWALITAAVLAIEQAGYIRLQAGPRTKYQSLYRSATYIIGEAMPIRWTHGSLEDRLCQMLSQVRSPYALEELVFNLIERHFRRWASHAWRFITAQAMQGLVARNLLRVPPDFPGNIGHELTGCYLLEPVAGLMARQSIEPVKHLFNVTAQQRPDLWSAIYGDVDIAVRRRAKRAGSLEI